MCDMTLWVLLLENIKWRLYSVFSKRPISCAILINTLFVCLFVYSSLRVSPIGLICWKLETQTLKLQQQEQPFLTLLV